MANVVKSSLDSPNLAEMIDRILDKGIVIDAWVKITLIGIDLIALEARIVIASIDRYLQYAQAIGLIEPIPIPPPPSPTPTPEQVTA
jgi:gas vesicle structural protein